MPRYPIPAGATELILEEPKFYVPPVAENLPPEVNAGNDITITLPVNSVQLIGNAKDPDGSILSVLWLQESGQPATIVNPNFQSTTITGLKEGINTFRFEANDDNGVKKTDTVVVTVKAAILEPQEIYGFGARALGGEGKQVINVTPATFKQNVASNRILRFTQGGTISGGVTLRNISYLTIDGNGFDVIFTNNNGDGLSVASGSHHIIIQNVSAIKCSNDCFNVIENANNVAFKKVFASGGGDGGIDFASGQYVTIQESIITECWNSGASLGTGREGSWLWVAMINNKERLPFVHSNYSAVGNPNAWVEGCLLWNWEGFGAAVGYKAKMVFKRNYVYSKTDPQKALSNKGSHGGEPLGYLFAEGNVSGNGLNVNTGTNMADIVLPDWAKAPITDAREAAQKILGLTFANPAANSLLKSISLM